MKYDPHALLLEYTETAILQGDCTLCGDYKTGNRSVKKLVRIYKLMEKDAQLAACILDTCFWHRDISVRTWAAAHALGLKVKTSEAIAILREISSREGAGILGFNAEMTLKVYEQKGCMKFY